MRDAVTVRVVFDDPGRSTVHRIRNFGEDLWSGTRDDNRCDLSLGDVDASTDAIEFRVRSGRVKAVEALIERLLQKHMMSTEARIETGS